MGGLFSSEKKVEKKERYNMTDKIATLKVISYYLLYIT